MNIHEIVESSSSSIEKVEHADHNLYRRHVNNRSNQKGGEINQGHSFLPSATFKVSSKFKEICPSTMSGKRVSGPQNNFCESNCRIPLTQGAKGPGGGHKDVQQELNLDFRTEQTFRALVVSHPSSYTSSVKNSESSTVTGTASEMEEIVSNECKIDSLSKRGTALNL